MRQILCFEGCDNSHLKYEKRTKIDLHDWNCRNVGFHGGFLGHHLKKRYLSLPQANWVIVNAMFNNCPKKPPIFQKMEIFRYFLVVWGHFVPFLQLVSTIKSMLHRQSLPFWILCFVGSIIRHKIFQVDQKWERSLKKRTKRIFFCEH